MANMITVVMSLLKTLINASKRENYCELVCRFDQPRTSSLGWILKRHFSCQLASMLCAPGISQILRNLLIYGWQFVTICHSSDIQKVPGVASQNAPLQKLRSVGTTNGKERNGTSHRQKTAVIL